MRAMNIDTIAGAITLWELHGRPSAEVIRFGFESLGLGTYAPHPATVQEALKIVLTELYQGSRVLIRPLESSKGWGVVHERADDIKLSHVNDVSVVVNGADVVIYGASYEMEARIRMGISLEVTTVPQQKLVYMLKRIINEKLSGVPIRESGGVYYIPEHKLELWRSVAEVIEASGGGSMVHILRTAIDDKAVRCVVDHVKAEVQAFKEKAMEDTSGMGERARIARFNATQDMIDKIKYYEDTFGVMLEESKAAMGELSVAIMMSGNWMELGE